MKAGLAVIGLGAMGLKYARWLGDGQVPGSELGAVCTGNEELARELEKDYPSLTICKTPQELFARGDTFDGVVIAAPHKEHLWLTELAFSHGKDVICEKPIGVTVGEGRRMCRSAQEAGRALAVMFQNRSLGPQKALKQLLEKEQLGELLRVSFHSSRYFRTPAYHQSGAWRSSWRGEGGGALMNQGQHILDTWYWLLGLPEWVEADIAFGRYNDFLVDDQVSLQMGYPGRLSTSFFLTTGELPKEERLELAGTGGKAVLTQEGLTIWRFEPELEAYRKQTACNSDEEMTVSYRKVAASKDEQPYHAFLENFSRHILEGEPLLVTGEDALGAIELCNAAYLAAWKGKRVFLPVDEVEYQEALEVQMEEEAKRYG